MDNEAFSMQVKGWLKAQGRNNQWLADHCGVKLSAVYSWFSTRGFPEDQKRKLLDMMSPEEETSLIRVPFSDQQLAETHKAASIVSSDFQQYCQRAIAAQVAKDLKSPPDVTFSLVKDAMIRKDDPSEETG